MANELTLKETQTPAAIAEYHAETDLTIERATYWAKSLMKVVDSCGLAKSMGGKKYLEVEGWQMIAEFAHVKPIIEWVRPWKSDDGELIGYEARCRLVNDAGEEIGAGESSCGMDAFPCRGKSGSEKDKAAKSAAQTWAISRALRNKFSFVARIAGYQPVPAEEMPFEHDEHDQRAYQDRPTQPTYQPPPSRGVISEAQAKRLFAIARNKGVSDQAIKAKMALINPAWTSTREITKDVYEMFCQWVEEAGGKLERTPDDDDPIPSYGVSNS